MTQRLPPRLFVAIAAVIITRGALSFAAWLRTGEWGWLSDIGQPIVIALLAWLVAGGHAWARWVLIAFMALWIAAAIGSMFTLASLEVAGGSLMAAGFAGLYAWTALELVLAGSSSPPRTSV